MTANGTLMKRCEYVLREFVAYGGEHGPIPVWIRDRTIPEVNRRASRNGIIATFAAAASMLLIGLAAHIEPLNIALWMNALGVFIGWCTYGITQDQYSVGSGRGTMEATCIARDHLLRFAVRIRDAARAFRTLLVNYQQWDARCEAQLEVEQPERRERYEQLLTRIADRLELAAKQFWAIEHTVALRASASDPYALATAIAAIDPENTAHVPALLTAPDPGDLLTESECMIEALDELRRDVGMLENTHPVRA